MLDILPIRDELLAHFAKISADRSAADWIEREMQEMLRLTNEIRARLGKPPTTATLVRLAEGLACGHSDYGSKWALHCAELVVAP